MKMRRFLAGVAMLLLCFGLFAGTAQAASRPAAPKLSVSNYESNGRLRITWTAVDGARTYKVYRSETETGGYSLVKSTTATGYTDPDTKIGVTYYYYVKTLSNGTLSSASNKVSGARKLPRPEVTLSAVKSSGKIQVSWDAVKGAKSYLVYRSENQKSWTRIAKITEPGYTDTEAKAGTKYYYRVKAVPSRIAGTSAYSSVRSFTCDLRRPVITVSNTGASGRVQITWNRIAGAERYRVYRSTTKTGGYEKIGSPSATSFTDTTGKSGTTYYYKVMATHDNGAANSAFSTAKSGKFVYPDGLTLTAELDANGKPVLSWNEVKGAVKYRVYRSVTRTGNYSLLSTRTRTSYPNSSAPEGLPLYYKVKAVSDSGQVLETSNTVRIRTPLGEETLKTRYVAVPMVNLYKAPTPNSDSVRVRYMEKLRWGNAVLTSDNGSWYRVYYQSQLMYLWVEAGTSVLTRTKSPDSYTGNTEIQQEVLDLALDIANNWNTVYAHNQSEGIANADGSYGFDCSGFVEYVLETVMRKRVPTYNLSAAVTVMQKNTGIYNAGYPGEVNAEKVSRRDLQPGDVLFFTCAADGSVTNSVGHCGIYLGNNEFVHSTTSWEDAVCVMPLNDRFLETLHSIRRFLPEQVTAADTEATLDGPYRSYKVYAKMDPDSSVVAYIPEGQTFTLLFTDSDGWAYVRTKSGVEGFTRSEYLA